MKAPFLKVLLPLIAVTFFSSCSTEHDDAAVTPKTEAIVSDYSYNQDELELADAINQYRQLHGLNALALVNHVSYKSQEHNQYMIEVQAINHDFFTERSQNIIEVLGAVSVSENVAYNYSTANAALHAWLQSPAHKSNIEGSFSHFGISVRTDAVTGNKYYTNMFVKI